MENPDSTQDLALNLIPVKLLQSVGNLHPSCPDIGLGCAPHFALEVIKQAGRIYVVNLCYFSSKSLEIGLSSGLAMNVNIVLSFCASLFGTSGRQ